MSDSADRIELNGLPVQVEDLRALVQTNYGHFTAMRVEGGGVRGLDLHLARLDASTRELFGEPLESARVRACLRHIVADAPALSLRINVFARGLDRDRLDRVVAPDVLVMASTSRPPVVTPVRVKSFVYARDAASIKHVGTFPLFHHRRLAQIEGFDDAIFTDASGRISEGSIWNVGFVDADGAIVWPDAPQLDGVSMQLLKAGLSRNGITTTTRVVCSGDLANYRAAFFTNASVPVRPIASIDAHRFDATHEVFERLRYCYKSNPIERL